MAGHWAGATVLALLVFADIRKSVRMYDKAGEAGVGAAIEGFAK